MKSYFIAFDFWNNSVNKYFSGIIYCDLKENNLDEACLQIIKDNTPEVSLKGLNLKVNSLNNIEV